MKKTNAVRILESEGINFELYSYDFNEDEIDALSVADKLNLPHELVFKTLVTKCDKSGVNVFVIPAVSELEMKKAARASGNKSIEMIRSRDLLDITGYIRGGCSPVGMKKKFPVFIEETAQMFENIYVSAGVRGMQLKINPSDLLGITDGKFADLI